MFVKVLVVVILGCLICWIMCGWIIVWVIWYCIVEFVVVICCFLMRGNFVVGCLFILCNMLKSMVIFVLIVIKKYGFVMDVILVECSDFSVSIVRRFGC